MDGIIVCCSVGFFSFSVVKLGWVKCFVELLLLLLFQLFLHLRVVMEFVYLVV